MSNLIPKPFLPLVFGVYKYGNMEGKAWGLWSRVVPSGRKRVDTGGRGGGGHNISHFTSTHP